MVRMMDLGMPYLLETPGVEDACREAHRLGLAFVELNASFPACDTGRVDAARLRELCEQYGIYMTLHAAESCDPFAVNVAVRAAWLKALEDELRLAVTVGMPIVNLHLASGVYVTLPDRRVFLNAYYWDEYLRCVQALRDMAEHCLTGTGTRLCIENLDGFMPHEVEALETCLLASPVIGLTLDIGHAHAANGADEAFYQRHLDKLWHMHVHDAKGSHPHLPLGEGEIDLPARLSLARRCGARAVLETKTLAALETSLRYLHASDLVMEKGASC